LELDFVHPEPLPGLSVKENKALLRTRKNAGGDFCRPEGQRCALPGFAGIGISNACDDPGLNLKPLIFVHSKTRFLQIPGQKPPHAEKCNSISVRRRASASYFFAFIRVLLPS
jgi:hypothetical protein